MRGKERRRRKDGGSEAGHTLNEMDVENEKETSCQKKERTIGSLGEGGRRRYTYVPER